MIELCQERIPSRSRFDDAQSRLCQCEKDHVSKHDEFPYLRELKKLHPAVFAKIKRDSIMTTGAAWKSEDAGPNRILRWMMLLSDEVLLRYDIRMQSLKP